MGRRRDGLLRVTLGWRGSAMVGGSGDRRSSARYSASRRSVRRGIE